MIIRQAELKDKDAVLQLLNELGACVNKKVKYSKDNEQAHILGRNNYDHVMKNKNVKLFVIEECNVVIGAASFFILTDMITAHKFAHIDDFVIKREYRGKRYGTKLMHYIIQYAKKKHISPIKISSSLQLTDAHHFYEKLGAKFAMKIFKFEL